MKQEMEYRIQKYILKQKLHDGEITKEEAVLRQIQLLEELNPPYRSIEEVGDLENRENTGNEKSQNH
jgi:hypothetical protein